MKTNNRGQGTVETMLIVAVGLIVLIATLSISRDSLGTFSSLTDSDLSRAGVNDLATSGQSAVSQGVGARLDVMLTLPNSALSINCTNRTILIVTRQGRTFRTVTYPVFGMMNVSGGRNYVNITTLAKGVCFGDVNLC